LISAFNEDDENKRLLVLLRGTSESSLKISTEPPRTSLNLEVIMLPAVPLEKEVAEIGEYITRTLQYVDHNIFFEYFISEILVEEQ